MLDTAIAGNYNMISCSDPSEAAGVIMRVRFIKTDVLYDDTMYLYKVLGNTQVPGEVQVSKSWVYRSQNVNKLEPRFEELHGKIRNGFDECPEIIMSGESSRKSGDTLILNFSVRPQGQDSKLLVCRYIKA